MASILSIFAGLGLIWIIQVLYKFFKFVQIYTSASSLKRYNYEVKGNRPWAFVTGSSDGIGRAFAHELAQTGFNIILHGRNNTKLDTVKQSLLSRFPKCEIRVVICDVTAPESEMISNIKNIVNDLRDINLTILINNVGGSDLKNLEDNTPNDIRASLSWNVGFTAQLTTAILPLLLSDNRPKLIMNIGSAAYSGLPWLSIYSGSKAFMACWSTALAREMRANKRDVEVMCSVASKVTATSSRDEKVSLTVPDSRTFARASLQRVGCGEAVVAGYWMHGVLLSLVNWLPEGVLAGVLEKSVREEMEMLEKNH